MAFAGDGPLKDDLQRLAGELGVADRVSFLGEITQVEVFLNALDVLVSDSSRNEGMSLAMLEGMSCGLPVVATRVAAAPELLGEGEAGILIPPRDTDSLADALQRLMQCHEQRTALGRAARRRLEERYSVAAMVESSRQLYLGLSRVRGSGGRSDGSVGSDGSVRFANPELRTLNPGPRTMSITALAWIGLFTLLSVLALVRSSWGIALYFLTFFANPSNWWWGEGLLAPLNQRWSLTASVIALVVAYVGYEIVFNDEGYSQGGRLVVVAALGAGEANYLAALVGMMLPMIGYFWFSGRLIEKLAWAFFGALGVEIILRCASRGAEIGTAW